MEQDTILTSNLSTMAQSKALTLAPMPQNHKEPWKWPRCGTTRTWRKCPWSEVGRIVSQECKPPRILYEQWTLGGSTSLIEKLGQDTQVSVRCGGLNNPTPVFDLNLVCYGLGNIEGQDISFVEVDHQLFPVAERVKRYPSNIEVPLLLWAKRRIIWTLLRGGGLEREIQM